MSSPSPLVTADELAGMLDRVRVADVRWYLPGTGRRGSEEYAAGHLPGAVFVDVDSEVADPPSAAEGRHPLPSPERFEAAMRRAGISNDDDVVAYDDGGGTIAARLWWLLRHFGHRGRALVLDGGIGAWRAAGGAITTAVPVPSPGRFAAHVAEPGRVATADDVDRLRLDAGAVVLDARSRERWEGRVEPIDSRLGRIPGARSAPFADNLADGRFRPSEELRARFEALGIGPETEVVAYCGSGVTACHDLLALEVAGLPPGRLYGGSYSQWAADPRRPVETG